MTTLFEIEVRLMRLLDLEPKEESRVMLEAWVFQLEKGKIEYQQQQQQQQQQLSGKELAGNLVDEAKEDLAKKKLAIANACGLTLGQIEELFGAKPVKLFTCAKSRNVWMQYALEKRNELTEKYRSIHNIASDQQIDKAGTKAINKMLSEEYRKPDPEDLKRVQREANDFNSEHGYVVTTNNMSMQQKLWVSDEVWSVWCYLEHVNSATNGEKCD
ncbi:hypothetical protein INT45_004240 [Circinella minor]|uniref:Uncharacterized protein n=1 Tax=Circinella minor TaxID=1195481 RepID=A0A8H7V4S1_9FUNG|nr:hypothetical protein INT45_004240 [Circinella minor]